MSPPDNSAAGSATDLARAVVRALLDSGVRHVVVCPGARNAPLSLALTDAARAGVLSLHTRIDERTAAFLALGIAKGSHHPAAVVTTSGTAAANLHPAVLEAAHAGLPLVAVTADRPARLRGTGANQTTDQTALFGDAAVTADIATVADIPALPEGVPSHWNVQLDDPLVPGDSWSPAPSSWSWERPSRAAADPLPLGPRTVVLAGDDSGPAARILAERANWPLLAEPTSGARNGDNPIRTYRLLLDTPLAERVERVVVYGHPTLSRPVSRLCCRADVEVVSVLARGRWPDRPFEVASEHVELGADPDDPAWLEEWRAADRALSGRLDALVGEQGELTPYDVAAEVHAAVPAGGLLYVGASNPIRDLDLMAGSYPPRQHRLLAANRGLAGIDGTLSAAIGATIGRATGSRAIAYVGDVTFLHDLTGLVIGPAEVRPNLTVVVVNDDGGSIFATLEQGDPRYADSFEKVFGTPHGADLGGLCAALRVPHWRVESRAELAHALAGPNGGIEVVEAVVRRDNRRELDERIKALATTPTE